MADRGWMKAVIVAVLFLAGVASTTHASDRSPATKPAFVYGVDLSLLTHLESHGVQYRDGGTPADALTIFKRHGWNCVRLRLFVDPDGTAGQVNTLAYTLKLAARVKRAGLGLLLDFHYSDEWADPGHQPTPKAWALLTHLQLVDRVYAYTRDTLKEFEQAGCPPDLVQVGNEISNGLLWPDGGPISEAKWPAVGELLAAGVRGVREAAPSARVILHTNRGGERELCQWFFDHVRDQRVDYDILGLSCYPDRPTEINDVRQTVAFLSARYDKEVMVVETDHRWRGVGKKGDPYPPTPDGQRAFLADMIGAVKGGQNSRGVGAFYWAPEWIDGEQWNAPRWSREWEDKALFDDHGDPLPALRLPLNGGRSPE